MRHFPDPGNPDPDLRPERAWEMEPLVGASLRRIESEVVACRICPRLVAHREHVADVKRRAFRDHEYWGRPVPGFGDPRARLVLIGLAPGAHGSNRTGRMFTGDASGDFLFPALHGAGFASQPDATSRDDDLTLTDCFITAAVRCAPPGNKPNRSEFQACAPYLIRELRVLKDARVYLALGRIGFDELCRALPEIGIEVPRGARKGFGHGAEIPLGEGAPSIVCSYHPSRQNTQTGRLTTRMFNDVFRRVARLLDGG